MTKSSGKEVAILYWSGSNSIIYDELFNSGNINGVLAWGGLNSIEDIRRRAYHYGIKIIDNGPKISFSVISEEALQNQNLMQDLASKIAVDIALWNQRALCISSGYIH